MGGKKQSRLSRREQEIMEVVYELGEASVHDVVKRLADRPSYDSVRVTMGILRKKGQLEFRREGRQYVYFPRQPVDSAMRTDVSRMMRTYFEGSPSRAVLAFLDVSGEKVTDEELARIEELIRKRKKR